jgi:ubiquinone/menaquinone biosynthesis C-methylase UbiE
LRNPFAAMTFEGESHVWGTAPDFVGPRHELREALLLALTLSMRPGRNVLNAGAGLGSFTRLLEMRGFDVTSTDVSEAAIDVLRERVRGPVLNADLRDLPFCDRSFDLVVAGEVIEHIENDAAALREAARVLRPTGVLVVSVPAHPTWFSDSDRWAGHARRYTRPGLEVVIARAGLDLVSLRPWGFPVSAAYHRWYYNRRAATLSTDGSSRSVLRGILKLVIQVDRLFVGWERGCLGYLAAARPHSADRGRG